MPWEMSTRSSRSFGKPLRWLNLSPVSTTTLLPEIRQRMSGGGAMLPTPFQAGNTRPVMPRNARRVTLLAQGGNAARRRPGWLVPALQFYMSFIV